jgi:hypothetical protein
MTSAAVIDAPRSATWRDVDRLHRENPNWGCKTIAAQLQREGLSTANKQLDAWVRATFARRGWSNPNTNVSAARKPARRFNVQREAPERIPAIRDRALPREEQTQAWWLKD